MHLPKSKSNPRLDIREVRAALVMRGSSLTKWSHQHGYHWNTVFSTLKKNGAGKKGTMIIHLLRKELGL